MTIFKDKTITDNFIFGAVMQNSKLCKALLECILNIKIREIKYPELEKTISKGVGSKSVRLDVYIEDEFDTIYNIEMQTTNKKNLPKRMRYYQGIIDINIIDKGEDYNKLKKSYVIFICDYDEFGIGRHIYTFENTCIQEPELKLNDDTVKIILNTKGTMDDVSDEVKELLHYIGGADPASDLTRSLDEEVNNVKSNKKWRREFMTLLMRDNENKLLGKYMLLIDRVKNLDVKDAEIAAKILGIKEQQIYEIKDYIAEHPEMDEDGLAEHIAYWLDLD